MIRISGFNIYDYSLCSMRYALCDLRYAISDFRLYRSAVNNSPSTIVYCFSPKAPTAGSWVTSMSVDESFLLTERIYSKTSWPVFRSRLPVGSSARITSGSLTRARAMATRCCSPPESSPGLWFRRCSNPTMVRNDSAFLAASFFSYLFY